MEHMVAQHESEPCAASTASQVSCYDLSSITELAPESLESSGGGAHLWAKCQDLTDSDSIEGELHRAPAAGLG